MLGPIQQNATVPTGTIKNLTSDMKENLPCLRKTTSRPCKAWTCPQTRPMSSQHSTTESGNIINRDTQIATNVQQFNSISHSYIHTLMHSVSHSLDHSLITLVTLVTHPLTHSSVTQSLTHKQRLSHHYRLPFGASTDCVYMCATVYIYIYISRYVCPFVCVCYSIGHTPD